LNPIESPIAGRVVAVHVAVGDTVAAGAAVLTIESMKMEIPVEAESGGVVKAIVAETGSDVEEGDVLVELD
jgi:biotin carboxyl carrier protein